MEIAIKRAYEPASRDDGARVLVDRLWPRGISKDSAALHSWLKELAPSNELCRRLRERPSMWTDFCKRYMEELRAPEASAALELLHELAACNTRLTLVYASRDPEHNNALVLKKFLEGEPKPPSTSGPAAGAAAVGKRARARR